MDIKKFRLGRDLRQSDEYGRFMQKLGWKVEKNIFIKNPRPDGRGFISLSPSAKYDSTSPALTNGVFRVVIKKVGFIKLAKIRRVREITDWQPVLEVLDRNRVNVCRIDPEIAATNEYKKHGFRLSRDQMVATRTLLLDLTKTEENLLKEFATETRRKLKKLTHLPTGRQGYEVKLNSFEIFYNILKEGYREIDVWCPPLSEYKSLVTSFKNKCFCMTVDKKAGCLVIIHKQVAEYYYASATSEGKAENLPYLVAWEAIKEAKKRGAKCWDWNGLYDERFPEKRYLGFSFFKKRFGGVELNFPGGFLGWRLLSNWSTHA